MHAIIEESVIFLSIFKWVGLSAFIGILVGLSTTFFLKVLHFSLSLTTQHPFYFLLLPFALFLSVLFIHYLSPDSEGHGTEKVIWAVHKRLGKMRFRVIPIKLVATVVTIAFGGSAGKEGPAAQIGGAIASVVSDFFKFAKSERRKLVICGISAGFAAVFGTPIAGAIFGVEVLFVGGLLYDVLLPSLVAGMVSYQVACMLGVSYSYHFIPFSTHFNPLFFLKIVGAGIFFGLVAIAFIETLKWSQVLSNRLKIWPPLKGFIGGVLLIMIALVFSPDYLNLGLPVIESALSGDHIVWYAFIIKIIATAITLSFGGSGGVLTPLFFIGATSGTFIASVFSMNGSNFAAIGMVSLLAGAANTPISASILAVELFGPNVAPYATICCVVCFLMTGYRSVFPSQIISVNKAPSVVVKQGTELDSMETHIEYSTRRTMATGRVVVKRIRRRFGYYS